MKQGQPGGAEQAPRRWWPRYVPLLLLALAAVAVLRPFMVENNDMAPLLQEGDLGLAVPLPAALFGAPRRGDLVLVAAGDIRSEAIRRVAALPGEVVELVAGKILVEGQPLSGDPVATAYYSVAGKGQRFRQRTEMVRRSGGDPVQYVVAEQEGVALPDRPGVTLGPDEYYVLADRRSGARDSRDYGPVKGAGLRRLWAVSLAPGYGLLSRSIEQIGASH